MIVAPIKTGKIKQGSGSIFEVLDRNLPELKEGSVVVITSKILSICEGRLVPEGSKNWEELIAQESEYYLPPEMSKFGHHFTIAHSTIVASGGIDHSNGFGNYVLWPEDPQKSANGIRQYLKNRFGLKQVGVIITDSVVRPLRRGTTGISIAHSGFKAVHNYIGQPDIFGRPLAVTWSNIVDGLAAAAVVVMGEGSERLPIVVIEDLDFVRFQDRNPTAAELNDLLIKLEDDLFEPFLKSINWLRGEKN